MGVGGQRHAPAALPPGKTRYPLYTKLGGSRVGLYGCGKSRPPPGLDLRTAQPVASRYTDWVIPAHTPPPTYSRSPWPRGLRRASAAARLLR